MPKDRSNLTFNNCSFRQIQITKSEVSVKNYLTKEFYPALAHWGLCPLHNLHLHELHLRVFRAISVMKFIPYIYRKANVSVPVLFLQPWKNSYLIDRCMTGLKCRNKLRPMIKFAQHSFRKLKNSAGVNW